MPSAVENVRAICKSKKIPISRIESDLRYGNGYFNPKKTKNIPSDRLVEIAKYLEISIGEITGGQKEAPAAQGDGLSDNEKEVIRLFRSASPETRAAMLHLLRVAEAAQSVQDADAVGR